jgi:hypothetical protein
MWESLWTNERWEVQMNTADKLFALVVNAQGSEDSMRLQFNQTELYELLQAILEVNRTFLGERPFFADKA